MVCTFLKIFLFFSVSQFSNINQTNSNRIKQINQNWQNQIKPNSTLNKTLSYLQGSEMSKSGAQLLYGPVLVVQDEACDPPGGRSVGRPGWRRQRRLQSGWPGGPSSCFLCRDKRTVPGNSLQSLLYIKPSPFYLWCCNKAMHSQPRVGFKRLIKLN